MILNASWKLIKEHGFETSAEFRRAAADFAARIAEMFTKTTGLLVSSLAKLKDVAAGGLRGMATDSGLRAQGGHRSATPTSNAIERRFGISIGETSADRSRSVSRTAGLRLVSLTATSSPPRSNPCARAIRSWTP